MEEIYNGVCNECGKTYSAKKDNDIEINNFFKDQPLHFCCIDHLNNWVSSRIIGLGVAIVIGLILAVAVTIFTDLKGIISFAMMFFLPYTIRLFGKKGIKIGNEWYSEFLAFFVFMIAWLFLIYPIIKLVTEILYYKSIKTLINTSKGMWFYVKILRFLLG